MENAQEQEGNQNSQDDRTWIRYPFIWTAMTVLTVLVAAAHLGAWAGDWELFGADGWHFLLGVLIAFVVGHGAAVGILYLVREKPSKKGAQRRAMWVGVAERMFFALVTAASMGWIVPGAALWATVKMAVNWEALVQDPHRELQGRARIGAMTALTATVVSLTFAVAGGLLLRASLPS